MEQEIEKIMVFKNQDELPAYLKHIREYTPEFNEKVVVLEVVPYYSNTLLKVKFGVAGQTCTLLANYFRTVKRAMLRQKLLSQVRTPNIEQLLKNI